MITTIWPQEQYFYHNPKFQRKVNSVTEASDLLSYKHPACYLYKLFDVLVLECKDHNQTGKTFRKSSIFVYFYRNISQIH